MPDTSWIKPRDLTERFAPSGNNVISLFSHDFPCRMVDAVNSGAALQFYRGRRCFKRHARIKHCPAGQVYRLGRVIGHTGVNIVNLRAFTYFRFFQQAFKTYSRKLLRGMVFQAAPQSAKRSTHGFNNYNLSFHTYSTSPWIIFLVQISDGLFVSPYSRNGLRFRHPKFATTMPQHHLWRILLILLSLCEFNPPVHHRHMLHADNDDLRVILHNLK